MTRKMTGRLDSALDSVSSAEWRAVAQMINEMDTGSVVRRLLFGLYAEHLASAANETRILAEHERDHAAYLDELESKVVWPGEPGFEEYRDQFGMSG